MGSNPILAAIYQRKRRTRCGVSSCEAGWLLPGLAVAARLDALHQLAPLRGRRLLFAHAFLLAAASDAELETAAAAHQAKPTSSPMLGWSKLCGPLTGCWSRPGT